MPTKTCSKCGETTDETNFQIIDKSTGKRKNYCKKCQAIQHKAWRDRNHDKVMRSVNKWREKNPSKVSLMQHNYYLRNKDKLLSNSNQYYLDNREEILQKTHDKQSDAAYRAKKNAYARQYRKAHPEVMDRYRESHKLELQERSRKNYWKKK